MFKTDYSKSEEMAKDMFKTVDNIVMQVKEAQDEFIFSTLNKYFMDNFNTVVKKEELIQAIHLIRMRNEHGPGIYERWTTATQQTAYLNDEYKRGFQDGVTKEHDRSPFSSEDNKEAMLKAFELFGFCMAAGPCDNCVFFDSSSLPEEPCSIGCPNSWPLFDTSTKNGTKNRNIVLDTLRRKEERK